METKVDNAKLLVLYEKDNIVSAEIGIGSVQIPQGAILKDTRVIDIITGTETEMAREIKNLQERIKEYATIQYYVRCSTTESEWLRILEQAKNGIY